MKRAGPASIPQGMSVLRYVPLFVSYVPLFVSRTRRRIMHTTLRQGASGPEVVRLQQLLNRLLNPSPNLVTDGRFGQKTFQAIIRFQGQHQLKPDGVAGPKTWQALEGQQKKHKAQAKHDRPPVVEKPLPADGGAPWMKIADQERVSGVHEIAGPQANARIVEYLRSTTLDSAMAGSDETPWCAAFVNWVLKQAGIATLNSASAAAWANWGIGLTQPRYGAVTVIHSAPKKSISGMTHSGNHVGFLVSETATHYELLGGNQSDSVKISQFNKGHWSLKGMRWPR